MYLIFDLGGTKLRLAASSNLKTFGKPVIVPAPKKFTDGLAAFRRAAKILNLKKPDRVVGGVPGPLDPAHTTVINAPHLPDWKNKPLKKSLEKMFNAPISLENDTALVGLGEASVGAGKGKPIVAYVTISTGVNGVRIVDGQIDRNANGFEIGHQIIDSTGPRCVSCNQSGHWEAFVSGTALQIKYGKEPPELTTAKIWDEEARLIAIGLNNTIVHWSPDIVVVGGGVGRLPALSIEKINKYLKQNLKIFTEPPILKKAQLGDLGGLYGAMRYIQQLVY